MTEAPCRNGFEEMLDKSCVQCIHKHNATNKERRAKGLEGSSKDSRSPLPAELCVESTKYGPPFLLGK